MADRDFDFFFGRWRVAHRRLVDRLQGCDRWESFDGACVVQPLLGGRANIDDNLINLPAGFYRAATLRTPGRRRRCRLRPPPLPVSSSV